MDGKSSERNCDVASVGDHLRITTTVENLKTLADVSSVGPSSERMEELWVELAYKGEDGATLLVETC